MLLSVFTDNAALIVAAIGAILGGGGITAIRKSKADKQKMDADVAHAREQAKKVSAEAAKTLVDSALDLQAAQKDVSDDLAAKVDALEVKLDMVIAEMRHWREVALTGAHEWKDILGEEPGWFQPFENK